MARTEGSSRVAAPRDRALPEPGIRILGRPAPATSPLIHVPVDPNVQAAQQALQAGDMTRYCAAAVAARSTTSATMCVVGL